MVFWTIGGCLLRSVCVFEQERVEKIRLKYVKLSSKTRLSPTNNIVNGRVNLISY